MFIGKLRESDVYGSPTFLLSQNNKPKEDLAIGKYTYRSLARSGIHCNHVLFYFIFRIEKKNSTKHVLRWVHFTGARLDLPLDSGTAEMLCGIQTNNPNAIFTWLKDGQPITRKPVFYKDDGRVLVLPNFTPADNGKYTCVTNDKSMSSSSTEIKYVDPGKNYK